MNEKNSNFYLIFIIISIVLVIFIFEYSSGSAQASNPNINNSSISNASQHPFYGDDIVGEFYLAHPSANKNTTITSFVDTYGISSWYDKRVYNNEDGYEHAYVVPAKNCSKKLVFLFYRPDFTGVNGSILWVKLIDMNEALPNETLPPVNTSISATPGINFANNIPGFTMNITIVSIISILLVSIYLKKK